MFFANFKLPIKTGILWRPKMERLNIAIDVAGVSLDLVRAGCQNAPRGPWWLTPERSKISQRSQNSY